MSIRRKLRLLGSGFFSTLAFAASLFGSSGEDALLPTKLTLNALNYQITGATENMYHFG
jgi:hypothetical protein